MLTVKANAGGLAAGGAVDGGTVVGVVDVVDGAAVDDVKGRTANGCFDAALCAGVPEPHAATANSPDAKSAYGRGERREEDEADMATVPEKPRTLWPLVLGTALATLAALSGCSSDSPARASSSPPPPTASTTSSVPVTSTAPTTTAPTIATTTTTLAPRPTTPTAAPAVRSQATSSCTASLAGQLRWTGGAQQLVTVVGSSYGTQTATVTLWQRSGSCWAIAGGPWTGFVGYNGFSDRKREGDGTTPTGAYGFGPVVYGNASDPGVHESYHRLICGDWWDENASSSAYNTFQHVACNTTPPWAPGSGSEALWTKTAAYPSFAVIDYNTGPIVAGAGSAIFLHASTGGATAGCVSIPLADLDQFLRWMQPAESPLVVMGPASEITRF